MAGSRLAARSRGRDAVASHGRGAGAVPFGFALQQSTPPAHAPGPRAWHGVVATANAPSTCGQVSIL